MSYDLFVGGGFKPIAVRLSFLFDDYGTQPTPTVIKITYLPGIFHNRLSGSLQSVWQQRYQR